MDLREASAVARSVLFAALLACRADAAEEAPKRTEDPTPEDDSPSSPYEAATRDRAPAGEAFTNEDLERLAEIPPGEPLSKATPQPPAPTRRVQARQPQPRAAAAPRPRPPRPAAAPKSRNERDAETRIATLEARVADLERAILAARNSHLPRAWILPKGDEQQLRRAREELSRARQELAFWRGEEP